jgi:hypothetical protein
MNLVRSLTAAIVTAALSFNSNNNKIPMSSTGSSLAKTVLVKIVSDVV